MNETIEISMSGNFLGTVLVLDLIGLHLAARFQNCGSQWGTLGKCADVLGGGSYCGKSSHYRPVSGIADEFFIFSENSQG